MISSIEAFKDYIEMNNMLTIEEFKKLPTKRKLAYYKKYRSVSYNNCHDLIRTFCFDKLCQYVSNMKKILDNCEHIEN